MENIEGHKQMSLQKQEDNALIWINTPYSYVRVLAGQTRLEQDVLLQASEHIQSGLKAFFDQERDKMTQVPNPLFVDGNATLLLEPVRIILADYGVSRNHYDSIRKAVENILDLKVQIPYKKNGEEGYMMMNVFSKGTVTDPTDSRSHVDFYINRDVAQVVLDMSLGYVQHPRKIARSSRNTYTTTLYMLIKHHCGPRQSCVIPLNEIKVALGLVERDPSTGCITSYLYPQYSRFKLRVIEKVKTDLDSMVERDEIDYTFDYAEIRPGGKQRGDPTALEFKLKESKLGKERKTEIRRTAARNKLITQLQNRCGDLKETELHEIIADVPDSLFKEFSEYAYKQLPKIIERVYPEDMAGYIKNSLRRWIKDKKQGGVLPVLLDSVEEKEAKRKAAKKDADVYRVNPGEYAVEFEELKQKCSAAYREWLDKATFIGSQRGRILIEFPDRNTLNEFEAFEQSPANKDEVTAFLKLYADVMRLPMNPDNPANLIRGVKKLEF